MFLIKKRSLLLQGCKLESDVNFEMGTVGTNELICKYYNCALVLTFANGINVHVSGALQSLKTEVTLPTKESDQL